MSEPKVTQGVTDALKRIVGRGAKPERLGIQSELHGLPGLPSLEGLHPAAAGRVIRDYIEHVGIDGLSGSYQVFGRTVSANTLRRCFRLELAYDQPNWTAKRRRLAVIAHLGANYTPDYWSRADGPEWDLLYILASQLADPAHAFKPSPLLRVDGRLLRIPISRDLDGSSTRRRRGAVGQWMDPSNMERSPST